MHELIDVLAYNGLVWKVKTVNGNSQAMIVLFTHAATCFKKIYITSSNSPARTYQHSLHEVHDQALGVLLPCHLEQQGPHSLHLPAEQSSKH